MGQRGGMRRRDSARTPEPVEAGILLPSTGSGSPKNGDTSPHSKWQRSVWPIIASGLLTLKNIRFYKSFCRVH